MNRISPLLLSLFTLTGLAATPARADLNSDLAFTAFSNVDVNAMAGGTVLQQRGGLLDFQRGITSQALYIIHAPPADVAKKLTTWDPARHSELKVWIHQHLPPHPAPGDYANLATLPDNGSVNYLVNTTARLNPSEPALQMSKAEAQMITPLLAQNLDKRALFRAFWTQVLMGRTANFLSPNFSTAVYSVDGGDVKSLGDIQSLLRSDAKVYRDFHPLLADTPIYGSTKAVPASLYFDCFDIQGYGALGTGAIFQLVNGPAIQSVDMEYYCNSGIYATIELEKIWPITVNGQVESLIWRQDLVSTPNVSYLHGIERLASSMLMLQGVKQGIDAFRAEFK